MEYVTLNNGKKMPIVGFGVFQIEDSAECEKAVYDAISVGYRSINTAQAYHNEEAVGNGIAQAISDGIVRREDLFITTKVWVTEFSYEKAKASILQSLKKLQIDYLDLCLLHQCLSDYYSAYHAMTELYQAGKIKALGVSNFSAERMADMCVFNEVKPAVNQVETHLFWQQYKLHEWMDKYDVRHEAWGPLAQHRVKEVAADPKLMEIGRKYGKTATQVFLRSLVQRGIAFIPKSTHIERMKENIDLFDFSLTDNEMSIIKTYDEHKSMWAEYDDPNIVEYAMS